MCLAIPGKVEEKFSQDGLAFAKVNFGGIKRAVCLEYTPEAGIGDYVLVHVGLAISVINEEEARRTYEALEAIGEIAEFAAQIEQAGTSA